MPEKSDANIDSHPYLPSLLLYCNKYDKNRHIKKFLEKIYKHMFLFLLTMTQRYDIMQKYRENVACAFLSCRRVGMKASP